MSLAFYDAAKTVSKVYAEKTAAGHQATSLLDYDNLQAQFTAAFFKVHLTQELVSPITGVDFESMIYSNSSASICGGGYGEMTECKLEKGLL